MPKLADHEARRRERGAGATNPTLAAELERACRDILDRPATRVGDRRRAAALFAAVDGITVQALAMPSVMTPACQRAALRLQVETILES